MQQNIGGMQRDLPVGLGGGFERVRRMVQCEIVVQGRIFVLNKAEVT
jgi:hypothetical protein